ncbi:MAG TPA: hypothetical protein VLY04_17625 [Bryobacteraceae bacterium]|nr:hypothetical protein [Bryobacteraceae bacterium]
MELSRKIGKNRCANLRWKGLYVDAVINNPEDDYSNDTSLWCQHTYKCVGPDGKVVDEFECSPARHCYEQL